MAQISLNIGKRFGGGWSVAGPTEDLRMFSIATTYKLTNDHVYSRDNVNIHADDMETFRQFVADLQAALPPACELDEVDLRDEMEAIFDRAAAMSGEIRTEEF